MGPPPSPTSVSSLVEEVLLHGRGLRRLVTGLAVVGAESAGATGSCSVQLDDGSGTEAGSDHRAQVCAGAERRYGGGPAASAMALGAAVIVDDQALDRRWPAYRTDAMREGVKSSMSVPLASGGRRLGVITLYSPDHRDLQATGLAQLVDLATAAADAVGLVELLLPPGQSPSLRLAERSDVQIAVGILVVSQALSAEGALLALTDDAAGAFGGRPQRATEVIRAASTGPPPADATPDW